MTRQSLADAFRTGTTTAQPISTGRRWVTSWSGARLSAAIVATRSTRASTTIDPLLSDEIEFFAAEGIRRDVPSGVVLAKHGQPVRDVHLVAHGAVAVLDDLAGRQPILAFALPNELCGAVPALLNEPAPWDTVTVADSSVVTIPTERFTTAVRERWVDRWSTRTLSWLAEIGARVADLDGSDLTAHVAALLLRSPDTASIHRCGRTLADLLDVDNDAIRQVLTDLSRRGAVRITRGRVTIARPDLLQAIVTAARSPRHLAG